MTLYAHRPGINLLVFHFRPDAFSFLIFSPVFSFFRIGCTRGRRRSNCVEVICSPLAILSFKAFDYTKFCDVAPFLILFTIFQYIFVFSLLTFSTPFKLAKISLNMN